MARFPVPTPLPRPIASSVPTPALLTALLLLLAAGCTGSPERGDGADVDTQRHGTGTASSSDPDPGHVPTPIFDEIPSTRSMPGGPSQGRSNSGAGTTGTTHAIARVTRHGTDTPRPPVEVVEVQTAEDRAGRCGALEVRADALVADLLAYADRPESGLADGERLKKYRLQRELIALHYLLPTDSQARYLEPLLDSLAGADGPPVTGHLLMVAAFYHDIDLEQSRDATLARLALPPTTARERRLELDNFCLCREVRGLRDYSPLGKRVLRRGQEVLLYGELTDLDNVRDNDRYMSGIEVIATLQDERGVPLHRQELSAPDGDRLVGDKPATENFFQYPYRLPMDVDSGAVRLVLEVRDIHSDARARGETSFRISRR